MLTPFIHAGHQINGDPNLPTNFFNTPQPSPQSGQQGQQQQQQLQGSGGGQSIGTPPMSNSTHQPTSSEMSVGSASLPAIPSPVDTKDIKLKNIASSSPSSAGFQSPTPSASQNAYPLGQSSLPDIKVEPKEEPIDSSEGLMVTSSPPPSSLPNLKDEKIPSLGPGSMMESSPHPPSSVDKEEKIPSMGPSMSTTESPHPVTPNSAKDIPEGLAASLRKGT